MTDVKLICDSYKANKWTLVCLKYFLQIFILYINRPIGILVSVFAHGPRDWGWIKTTPKTKRMVLDATLLNTQHYKEIWVSRANRAIGLIRRVFANGSGDLGSILCRIILKTQKMVLDAALLNTQHYKVRDQG